MPNCRLCGAPRLRELIDLGEHPIAHKFLKDPAEDEYTHPVLLHVCEECALVQLVDPVPPEMLYTDYVTLSSWKPQPHVPRLIEMLGAQSRLDAGSSVLEVGSNDGGFLKALSDAGYHDLLGVEPANDAREAAQRLGVETLPDYFDQELGRKLVEQHGPYDLFVARQVLEHIERLDEFAAAMRTVMAPGALVLVEVPNFSFALDTHDYSAIWEEHVNYFTPETFERFLAKAGVRVLHNETFLFSGEIQIVLGEFVGDDPVDVSYDVDAACERADEFARDWEPTKERITSFLADHSAAGGKIAVYGGGCRSCSFINYAGLGPHIDAIVDDQPEKQGLYMPGSRLPILPSSELLGDGIDLCLLAVNAENEEKVIARNEEFAARGGRFASLHPPSDRLLDALAPSHA